MTARTLTPLAAQHAACDWQTFRDMLTGREYRATGIVVRAVIIPAEVRAGIDVRDGWWSYRSAATIREMFAGDSLGQRVDLAIWQDAHPAPERQPTVTEAPGPLTYVNLLRNPRQVMHAVRKYYGRDCHDTPQVHGNSGWLNYQRFALLREAAQGEAL